jgi:hypothetical protein
MISGGMAAKNSAWEFSVHDEIWGNELLLIVDSSNRDRKSFSGILAYKRI